MYRLRRIGPWLAILATVVAAAVIVLVLVGRLQGRNSQTGAPPVPIVDATLDAVSASAPSPAAAKAMDLCYVEVYGSDRVAGMAQVPANKLTLYLPFAGVEPELQTDALVWAIAFQGEFTFSRSGTTALDPVCVVNGDDFTFYAPSGYRDRDGTWTSPIPRQAPPQLALPPLAP